MHNLKINDTNEHAYRKRLTDLEKEFMVARERADGGGIVRELGMDMYILGYVFERDNPGPTV